MFIKLTEQGYPEATYFNTDTFLSFFRYGYYTVVCLSPISSDLKNTIKVKETPEEILAMIKDCEK